MEPGHGAEDQASRRGRKLARLKQEHAAGLGTDDQVRRQIEQTQRQQRAWSAGAEGERLVATTLGTLAQYGWVGLHDLRWPDRPLANIDHIAVGPGGVVIVDAKNWTGDVVVRDGLLYQNGYHRAEHLHGVAQAAAAVTALLSPEHRWSVRGLVCLAAQEDFPPTVTSAGVGVVGRHHLASVLVEAPAKLSPYEVADIARHLAGLLDHGPRDAAARALSVGRGASYPRAATKRDGEPRSTPRTGRQRRHASVGQELRRGLLQLSLVAVVLLLLNTVIQSLG